MCVDADCVNVQCPASQSCHLGTCLCATGLFACHGQCVDTSSSQTDCGGCNQPCTIGTCSGGQCKCQGNGILICAGVCTDTQSDANNCGACNKSCSPGQTCVQGLCSCALGKKLCGGLCTDVTQDNANCGNCGVVCGPGTQCVNNLCQPNFICQTSFNPSSGSECNYYPLDDANCGAATQIGFMHLQGTTAAGGLYTDLTPAPPGQLFVASGNINNGAPNEWDFVYDGGATMASNTTPGLQSLGAATNVYYCDTPVGFVMRGNGTYDVTLTRYSVERYNQGGTSIDAPSALATKLSSDGGTVVCDHRCGAFRDQGCGDKQQYFSFTLPPGRAAVGQVRSVQTQGYLGNTGDTLAVDAYTAAGQFICSFIAVGGIYYTPLDAQGRIVNNTNVAQPLVLYVHSGRAEAWQFNTMMEP
jgi:hypothetical protein